MTKKINCSRQLESGTRLLTSFDREELNYEKEEIKLKELIELMQ